VIVVITEARRGSPAEESGDRVTVAGTQEELADMHQEAGAARPRVLYLLAARVQAWAPAWTASQGEPSGGV
jgi:hypothetical protein